MPIYALGEFEPQIDSGAYVHPEAVIIGNVTIGSEGKSTHSPSRHSWPSSQKIFSHGSIGISIHSPSIHTSPSSQ